MLDLATGYIIAAILLLVIHIRHGRRDWSDFGDEFPRYDLFSSSESPYLEPLRTRLSHNYLFLTPLYLREFFMFFGSGYVYEFFRYNKTLLFESLINRKKAIYLKNLT